MPTGYTAGIIDGEIKTFNEFAKICIRAFGAAVHMRDESMDKPYEPREPSDYYKKRIVELEKRIKAVSEMEAETLVEDWVTGLIEEKRRLANRVLEIKDIAQKLNSMIDEVNKWTPPTADHLNFKKFMLDQLNDTLKHDGDTKYYIERVEEVDRQLKMDMDGEEMRKSELEDLANDLESAKKNWTEEQYRCTDANI